MTYWHSSIPVHRPILTTFCLGYALAEDVAYLFREQRNSFDDMVTMTAGIKVRYEVTYLETLGPSSCSSPVHCPLAGSVLVGDSMGVSRIFTDSGDVALHVGAPEGNPGAVRLAGLLKFRPSRQCVFDILLLAYFDDGGVYGVQIDYKTGVSSGWQQLFVPSTIVVDMKLSRGKLIDGMFSIHSFLLLDEDGSVFYNKDLKVECARGGRLVGSDWTLRHVGREIQSIHASVKLGAYMVSKLGEVTRIDRRRYEPVSVCNTTESAEVVQRSFEETSGEIFMSSVLETGLLIRSKLSKGTCKELHRLQIAKNVGKYTKIASSGGLSLVFNKDRFGLGTLSLFNHSDHLVKKYPGPWDTSRFVSFSSPSNQIFDHISLSLPERIRNRISRGSSSLTVGMNLWNRASMQVHNVIVVVAPQKNIILIYRPLFKSNRTRSDSGSLDMMHVVMGIFKSVALMLAAAFGLRFATAKNKSPRPVLGELKRDMYPIHEFDRDSKPLHQRRDVKEHMPHHIIDRAPDEPQTRIVAEDFWMD